MSEICRTAEMIVEAILENLEDRSGFDHWWDGLDDGTASEIRQKLADIVEAWLPVRPVLATGSGRVFVGPIGAEPAEMTEVGHSRGVVLHARTVPSMRIGAPLAVRPCPTCETALVVINGEIQGGAVAVIAADGTGTITAHLPDCAAARPGGRS